MLILRTWYYFILKSNLKYDATTDTNSILYKANLNPDTNLLKKSEGILDPFWQRYTHVGHILFGCPN